MKGPTLPERLSPKNCSADFHRAVAISAISRATLVYIELARYYSLLSSLYDSYSHYYPFFGGLTYK